MSRRSTRRRSLAIREEYADKLSYYAKSRGMTISAYLSDLISAAAEVESMGVYAPRALREMKLIYQLLSYQMVFVPLDFLSTCKCDDTSALMLIRRIAKTLKMLNIDHELLLNVIMKNVPYVIDDGERYIITKHEKVRLVAKIVEEFAKALKLKVEDLGDLLVIHKGKGV